MKQKIIAFLFLMLGFVWAKGQNKIPFNAEGNGNGASESATYKVQYAFGQNSIGTIQSASYRVSVGLLGPTAKMFTGITPERNLSFSLYQNYPNPFRETTTIPFETTRYSDVRLTVKNVLGEDVKILVSQKLYPGKHLQLFKAVGLGAGLYFYELKIDNQKITKPMILTK